MRRTTLQRTTVTAAAATLLLAGCGTEHDGTGPGRDGDGSPSASGPRSAPEPVPGCADHAELTTADSGQTLCLRAGGQVRLTLDGTEDRPWTPVKSTGTALRSTNAGIVILPGDAVAAFDAVTPGTARLTSTRPLCPTGPGRTGCKGTQQWTVTVKVARP
ncbi:hypothetical protein [Streptomyces kebangsaanensis]|uniref:hypothetical protein n=1 Tax=Streptomyces kebangsaanensis TaxID=864058 RepID=UPI00093A034A|nr:hypothetical protein [Streptomyces kebangsaanensis]